MSHQLTGLLALAFLLAPATSLAQRYVGAEKCAHCHSGAKAGSQFERWKASRHATATDAVLKADPAKAGIDLQDSEARAKCMRCHSTAASVKADKMRSDFKPKDGVQCESCHGPGERHVKARNAAAGTSDEAKIPEGELSIVPDEPTCIACHNKECPFFEGFRFAPSLRRIVHPVPPRKR